jgi:uncharacterized protein (DUF305 family)
MRTLAVGLLALLAAACTTLPPAATPTPVPQQTPSTRASQFDQQFIDMMVGHHRASLEMARIAVTRSQRPEIQEIAAAILAEQPNEIADMQQWRADWFGSPNTPPLDRVPTLDVSLTASGQPITADLGSKVEALRSAPEPFDIAFIDAMVPVHQRETDVARMAILQANHQEILDLAGEVLAAQVHEIELLQGWRKEWFGQ